MEYWNYFQCWPACRSRQFVRLLAVHTAMCQKLNPAWAYVDQCEEAVGTDVLNNTMQSIVLLEVQASHLQWQQFCLLDETPAHESHTLSAFLYPNSIGNWLATDWSRAVAHMKITFQIPSYILFCCHVDFAASFLSGQKIIRFCISCQKAISDYSPLDKCG